MMDGYGGGMGEVEVKTRNGMGGSETMPDEQGRKDQDRTIE